MWAVPLLEPHILQVGGWICGPIEPRGIQDRLPRSRVILRPWATVGYPLKPGCCEALTISDCIDDVIIGPVGWTEDPAGWSRGAKAGEGAGGVHSISDRPSFSSGGGSR